MKEKKFLFGVLCLMLLRRQHWKANDMDLTRRIIESQTIEELLILMVESLYDLIEYEQSLVFERKVEIITRRAEWAIENERMGLPADLTESWTYEQRERFLHDWENDEPFLEDSNESGYEQLLFFDFECRQENGTHEPNLCVIQNKAGDEWVFQGHNTQNEFCEWLFTKEHANCIVVAHNFQGYDGYFIQQFLHENGIIPEVILHGAKILMLNVPTFKIKFIDSLSFIPMRLADFPKTFGIYELAKGYFPHLFNWKENENYVGPIPPTPYYQPNGMSPDQKEKFMEWHRALKESNYVFDFQEEILDYCRSDVDILRLCCLEFRKLFRDVTDIDPFEKCLTIASACSLVYRTNFLDEDTIAVITPHGYRSDGKQSVMALKWLSYTAEKNEIYIQHIRNGGERRVGNYLLDGYHEETNTAYEFHGCFWHGNYIFCTL